MLKIITTILFVIGVLISLAARASINQKMDHEIQKIIDQNRIAYQIPGLQVSIIFPGETEPHDFVSGTTTLNGTQPVTPLNLFQIGSETKSFTAATLLMLEAEGKLSLDDPIAKWLPQRIPTSWQTITIRQLLNQSSKIYNYTDSDDFVSQLFSGDFKKTWTSDELIQLAFDKPFCDTWCYSNTNFILAGMIIEAVTGDSIEHVMTTRLFNPLQLKNTYYFPNIQIVLPRMAHGYSKSGTFPVEPKDITDLNLSWGRTSGAIVSNSHDTAIWLKKLLDGSLLPKKQLEELTTTVPEGDGSYYGLGLEQDFDSFNQETWEHNGKSLGYSSWMIWLKKSDIVITIIINDATRDMSDINRLLLDLSRYLAAPIQPDIKKRNQVRFG